ncbi:MAG: toxin [Gemmatimonadaceae bacterium]
MGFEDVVFHIERGDLLDILEHANPDRYAGQRILVVQREDYVYLVPFVEDEHTVFLKTIIPSRKATKEYAKATFRKDRRLNIRPSTRPQSP